MMVVRTRRRTEAHETYDFGPAKADGTTYRPVDVVEVAETPTRVIKRARRAHPMDLMDMPQGWKTAAHLYLRAIEHMDAGHGMGPIELDRAGGRSGSDEPQPLYWGPQERALSAAEWYRRGVVAMGVAAAEGVVSWVVVRRSSVMAYDGERKWRRGTARVQFREALKRLAEEYDCPDREENSSAAPEAA